MTNPSLANPEGTVEFKVDAYDLFGDYDGDDHNLIMATAGPVGIRVYRPDPETLAFDRIEPPNGKRTVDVNIEGLDQYDRFRVFLVWKPDGMNLHIGPHPPTGGELRSARDDTQ